MTLVGVLGHDARASVGALGDLVLSDGGWGMRWWIGADDRWRSPEHEVSVRQALVDDAPVVRTTMRVPSGDVVQTVYAVAAGDRDVVLIDVENASPAPFVAAFVVRHARAMRVDGSAVVIDGRTALVAPRPPSRWAVTKSGTTEFEVWSGSARDGDFPVTRDRSGRIEAAFLYPVPHRTTLRVALVGRRPDQPFIDVSELRGLPDAAAAARGWQAHLDRGMRVDLPDEVLLRRARASRGQVLLATTRPSGADAAALEDWGLDAEAAEAWRNLTGRERRRAGRRPDRPATWAEVSIARDGSELLLALRGFLVHEHEDTVTVLGDLPPAWRGQPVDVHDAPTRHGPVSVALRWHGARPALLWEAPPGVRLVAPGLDPAWETTEPSGEALLAEAAA